MYVGHGCVETFRTPILDQQAGPLEKGELLLRAIIPFDSPRIGLRPLAGSPFEAVLGTRHDPGATLAANGSRHVLGDHAIGSIRLQPDKGVLYLAETPRAEDRLRRQDLVFRIPGLGLRDTYHHGAVQIAVVTPGLEHDIDRTVGTDDRRRVGGEKAVEGPRLRRQDRGVEPAPRALDRPRDRDSCTLVSPGHHSAGIEIVATLPGHGERDASFKTAQDILEKYPQLDAFFCINDPTALGAVAAIEKAGRSGKVKVIGPISEEQKLAAAFRQSGPKLRDAFDAYLRKIKANGSYDALVNKYYPGIRKYLPDFFAK